MLVWRSARPAAWSTSAQKQPGVRWYPLFPRYRPPLFFARCPGYVGRHASPETSGTPVLLLEGDPPASRVETQKLNGGLMPDALPPRRPDHEELAHNLQFLRQAPNQRKARKSLTAVNQVAAPVGIFEEGWEPPGFVKPFAVRHVAPELGQVVTVQLPQPGDYMSLLAGGDEP